MFLLKLLTKAALATNLVYRVLVTSLLIAGTMYEVYKHFKHQQVVQQKRLAAPHG